MYVLYALILFVLDHRVDHTVHIIYDSEHQSRVYISHLVWLFFDVLVLDIPVYVLATPAYSICSGEVAVHLRQYVKRQTFSLLVE